MPFPFGWTKIDSNCSLSLQDEIIVYSMGSRLVGGNAFI